MRLAVFIWEFPPRIVGGLGTYISEIAPRFVKMGSDVSVFTLNDGNLEEHEVINGIDVYRPKILNSEDVVPTVIAEDIRRWGTGIRFFADLTMSNILSVNKLVNELVRKEHRNYDAIVVHDWLSIMGGMIARRELDIPLIFHLHSTEKGRNLGEGSKTVRDLESVGAQKADHVITVSYAMRDELLSLGFPQGKINVVYNGVDPLKYDPQRVSQSKIEEIRRYYGLGPSDLMVLFIGRIVAVKGVDRLVQSMVSVRKRIPNAKLVIVGTSDMQYSIEELVSTLKLEDCVKFRFEWIPEEERIAHYAASDLCVFPSLYEPFGIVALEAMSMAKPVVVGARGVSGMKEFVIPSGPGQTGFHINPYEPMDIAWGITSALEDPRRAREMGENGRKLVIESFAWEGVAARTLKLYEDLLNRGARKKEAAAKPM
ncbi:MAG TPA: glycosyltransferase family 4 protein [Nitrososphaerales archaeon]|nr:glycosyltransferase family 4 protein [Nitrososphaerales archaeon]